MLGCLGQFEIKLQNCAICWIKLSHLVCTCRASRTGFCTILHTVLIGIAFPACTKWCLYKQKRCTLKLQINCFQMDLFWGLAFESYTQCPVELQVLAKKHSGGFVQSLQLAHFSYIIINSVLFVAHTSNETRQGSNRWYRPCLSDTKSCNHW